MIRVRGTELHQVEMRTRIPFRYGIAEMRAVPHVVLRAQVEVDGRQEIGMAADHLPPKWFTKDPDTDPAEDVAAMRRVIEQARALACELEPAPTAFSLWRNLAEAQAAWAVAEGLPGLLSAFGVTFVERAVIEACCRAAGMTFGQAVRADALGIDLGAVYEQLADRRPAEYLPARALRRLAVRHTVGLGDPLDDGDLAPGARPDDGLPSTLAEAVRAYGLARFKIKVAGQPEADRERLARITALLQREVGDESDAELRSLAQALEYGYAGASYKGCKGVFKGIANVCLVGHEVAEGRPRVISAEDLTTVGPVALVQDLAVVASLGIPHVERNGHHYFRGLSAWPREVQDAAVQAHPDLYRRHDRGFVTLAIDRGEIRMGSVVDAPFGRVVSPV